MQRVTSASVTVGDRTVGAIGPGLLALVGAERGDTADDARYIAGKIQDLRVFVNPDDPSRQMDRSVRDADGSVLVVSQFTLAADCRKGRRPSFDDAETPELARPLIEEVVSRLRAGGVAVEEGEFQAMMHVALVNDGPVTLLIDSRKRF